MGGRVSGESSRDEKVAVGKLRSKVVRPYQIKAWGAVGTAVVDTQTSRQQLSMCDPLGQHGLGEASEPIISVAVWQSGCIQGVTAAKAAKDP